MNNQYFNDSSCFSKEKKRIVENEKLYLPLIPPGLSLKDCKRMAKKLGDECPIRYLILDAFLLNEQAITYSQFIFGALGEHLETIKLNGVDTIDQLNRLTKSFKFIKNLSSIKICSTYLPITFFSRLAKLIDRKPITNLSLYLSNMETPLPNDFLKSLKNSTTLSSISLEYETEDVFPLLDAIKKCKMIKKLRIKHPRDCQIDSEKQGVKFKELFDCKNIIGFEFDFSLGHANKDIIFESLKANRHVKYLSFKGMNEKCMSDGLIKILMENTVIEELSIKKVDDFVFDESVINAFGHNKTLKKFSFQSGYFCKEKLNAVFKALKKSNVSHLEIPYVRMDRLDVLVEKMIENRSITKLEFLYNNTYEHTERLENYLDKLKFLQYSNLVWTPLSPINRYGVVKGFLTNLFSCFRYYRLNIPRYLRYMIVSMIDFKCFYWPIFNVVEVARGKSL